MIQTIKLKLVLRFFNAANVSFAGFYRTCIPDGEKVTSGGKEAETIPITSTSLTVESTNTWSSTRRVVKCREKTLSMLSGL